MAIDYAVGDGPTDLEEYVAQKDRVDGVIARETEAALGEWVSGRLVDEVLLTGNVALPGWLVRRVQERVASVAAREFGCSRRASRIWRRRTRYEAAFEEVNTAQTNARAQEQRAHQEAARLLRDAEATAYQDAQQSPAVTRRPRRRSRRPRPMLSRSGSNSIASSRRPIRMC